MRERERGKGDISGAEGDREAEGERQAEQARRDSRERRVSVTSLQTACASQQADSSGQPVMQKGVSLPLTAEARRKPKEKRRTRHRTS